MSALTEPTDEHADCRAAFALYIAENKRLHAELRALRETCDRLALENVTLAAKMQHRLSSDPSTHGGGMSTRSHLIFAHYWCAAWATIAAACLAANIMDGPAWLASADTLFLVGYLKWANDAHREAQQALRGTP